MQLDVVAQVDSTYNIVIYNVVDCGLIPRLQDLKNVKRI